MKVEQVKKELKSMEKFTIPEARKLSKRIANDNYKEFLDSDPMDSFEIKMVHAFVIGYAKDDLSTLMKYFEDFIPYVDDWAINDALCQNFKITKKHPEEVWNMLMKHKDSYEDFEVRVVSVMLLTYYLNDEYIDRVLEVIDNLHLVDYYSKMGVAWALATAMAKDKCPKQTKKYMESKNIKIDDWTFNKSLQKMRESFRVSNEIKEWTRKMKK